MPIVKLHYQSLYHPPPPMTDPTPAPHSADPVVSFLYQLAAKEAKDCQFETAVKIRACADSIAQRDARYPAAADQEILPEGPNVTPAFVKALTAFVKGLTKALNINLGNANVENVRTGPDRTCKCHHHPNPPPGCRQCLPIGADRPRPCLG
jgi:hypothetical protein